MRAANESPQATRRPSNARSLTRSSGTNSRRGRSRAQNSLKIGDNGRLHRAARDVDFAAAVDVDVRLRGGRRIRAGRCPARSRSTSAAEGGGCRAFPGRPCWHRCRGLPGRCCAPCGERTGRRSRPRRSRRRPPGRLHSPESAGFGGKGRAHLFDGRVAGLGHDLENFRVFVGGTVFPTKPTRVRSL